MQRQAVLHWNRRLECLNRISQKALREVLGAFFMLKFPQEMQGNRRS